MKMNAKLTVAQKEATALIVRMPEFEQFTDEADFWATLAHEALHWTGAPNRLNRVKGKVFGDSDYAVEELIAELGSVMLLANFGIKPIFDNSTYINRWIDVLKEDYRLIFKIASQAQKAADMIYSEQALLENS
jgi:antirestriction protein ArdC